MRQLRKSINRRVGRALHDYKMLDDGDRVLVAVSGGIDSLLLAYILRLWLAKAPISYTLQAIHVDMAPSPGNIGAAAEAVAAVMAGFGLPLEILPASWQPSVESLNDQATAQATDTCFRCARSRRTQLFEFAREHDFSKVALGHHRDDIIDTFFMNLTSSGNISTMRPRQDLFSGRLSILRPMAYLDKNEIEQTGAELGLEPIRSPCPLSEQTRRRDISELTRMIYEKIPGSKEHIFAALHNVRQDYLLQPLIDNAKKDK